MNWELARIELNKGNKIKLPEWTGFWYKLGDKVLAFTFDCKIVDASIEQYLTREDWEVTDGLRSYSGALQAMSAWRGVSRQSWELGEFIYRSIPNVVSPEVFPRMNSIPAEVKEYLVQLNDNVEPQLSFVGQLMKIKGNEVDSYSPTTEDQFAKDWVVL